MSFPESTPEVTRWCAFLFAIVFGVFTVLSLWGIYDSETTGIAYYQTSSKMPGVRVTQSESPKMFHDAIAQEEMHLALFAGLAFIGYTFYQKLSD